MLYVSSRNKTESYTAYRALHNSCAPDGGMFIPFNLPSFDTQQIAALQQLSFGQVVAQLLNTFFSAGLTDWDVECCIGRMPVRLAEMSHRLTIAELWHNPENRYSYLEKSLYAKLTGTKHTGPVTQWAWIAIRIAVLFGIFTLLSSPEQQSVDIAVATGDFTLPMAAWYARKMGLPISRIICTCNENSAAWDLIHRGEFNTNSAVVATGMPELDHSCPEGVERLIFDTLGQSEVQRYLSVYERKGTYRLDENSFSILNEGLSAAVVGHDRIRTIQRSIFRTNDYIADNRTALTYGGLQDYRAHGGESRHTLLLSDCSPLLDPQSASNATGLSKEELVKRLNGIKE